MACVNESIGHFVVDIWVVADLNDFSHCATSAIPSQSSTCISNLWRSLFFATKSSMTDQ